MLLKILAARLQARRPPIPPTPAAEVPADERPLGCGWFDSSHELNCGLQVTEHLTPDAVASELPLADWIAMQLSLGPACQGVALA